MTTPNNRHRGGARRLATWLTPRRLRITGALLAVSALLGTWAWQDVKAMLEEALLTAPSAGAHLDVGEAEARAMLADLTIAGPASGAGYDREAQFHDQWPERGDCDLRDEILNRDLTSLRHAPGIPCLPTSGLLIDPYTGAAVSYERGVSDRDVQIDDVVSLYNAWTTGAQTWPQAKREAFAADPLNLLAVHGGTNETKRHHDASQWTPPNPAHHCAFAATQIAVKHKYELWVTPSESEALQGLLDTCGVERRG